MAATVLADTVVSISDLKKNPMVAVAQGEGFPVAVLNRNHPAFYCIPAESYEMLLDRIEDLEMNALGDRGRTKLSNGKISEYGLVLV